MSGRKEGNNVQKEKGDLKTVSHKTDDRGKFKKKIEKRISYERRCESTSSNHTPPEKVDRNPPKRNLAQNRLKKLRAKLDNEIKLKEKIEAVGISRLLNESVVQLEKNRPLLNKQKLPRIPRIDNRTNTSNIRNFASERLKKVKKEIQTTIEIIQNPAIGSACEKDSHMEIDEDIEECDEKIFSKIDTFQNTKEVSLGRNSSLSSNSNSYLDGFSYQMNLPHTTGEFSFHDKPNVSNNNVSYFDVIPFINNEISKIREEPSYMALHTNLVSDSEMEVDTPGGELLIVIDTNVFLSCLNIVDYLLKNSSIPALNSCVLVVPWPVIQEIDYAMKKNNELLNNKARFANNFINDCLKKKHPRFFGQSLTDFKENFKNAVNIDDFILQYCMKFLSFSKKVILLTNDKNLCNKAMMNNLSVFTTKEFVNTFNLSDFF